MRNLTEKEISMLDGYIGDHGETSDGKGNILHRFDNRELEKHKILMHNQLWEIFDQKYVKEAPIYKQMNSLLGVLDESEDKIIKEKLNKLRNEYEKRKQMIYAATTCDEAHEAVHNDL